MTKSFDKIQKYLFDDHIPLHEKQFTDHELVIRDRWRNVFTYWLDKPTLSDAKVIQYIRYRFKLSKTQAYLDLFNIKIILGNVRNANKQWQRFKLNQMIDEAYELAKEKRNPIAMAAVIDKLGKYNQLDKEESEKIPYDEIVPQNFEVTGDVSVLGITPLPNLEDQQRQMRKKYGSTLIEETEFEIVDDEGN